MRKPQLVHNRLPGHQRHCVTSSGRRVHVSECLTGHEPSTIITKTAFRQLRKIKKTIRNLRRTVSRPEKLRCETGEVRHLQLRAVEHCWFWSLIGIAPSSHSRRVVPGQAMVPPSFQVVPFHFPELARRPSPQYWRNRKGTHTTHDKLGLAPSPFKQKRPRKLCSRSTKAGI